MSQIDPVNARFAFLDIETTGVSPWFGDRICEIAIVLTDGKRIRKNFSSLINPGCSLSPGSASSNGLTDAMLEAGLPFKGLARQVEAMLADAIIVCHNASYIMQFLDREFRRAAREVQFPNLVDTLYIAQQHYEMPSYGLTNIAAQFDIQNPEANRALGDALTTRNIFFAMLENLRGIRQLEDFVGAYNSPAWPGEVIHLPLYMSEAIRSGRRLHITYVDKDGERTQRWVTPLGVMGLSDYIYLTAFCHLRGGERTFRIDRIVELATEA